MPGIPPHRDVRPRTHSDRENCEALIVKQYSKVDHHYLSECNWQKSLVDVTLKVNNAVESLWSIMSPKARNKVRQAEGKGLEVVIANNTEQMDAFYELFTRVRHKKGIPTYSKAFFTEIYENLISLKGIRHVIPAYR